MRNRSGLAASSSAAVEERRPSSMDSARAGPRSSRSIFMTRPVRSSSTARHEVVMRSSARRSDERELRRDGRSAPGRRPLARSSAISARCPRDRRRTDYLQKGDPRDVRSCHTRRLQGFDTVSSVPRVERCSFLPELLGDAVMALPAIADLCGRAGRRVDGMSPAPVDCAACSASWTRQTGRLPPHRSTVTARLRAALRDRSYDAPSCCRLVPVRADAWAHGFRTVGVRTDLRAPS